MSVKSTALEIQVAESAQQRKYGWFPGVFRPTLTSILAIMFIREPWVVGNAGVLGSLLIMSLAFGIVTMTAMSMSCITTNIRIGAGGAFSIISQSLGLEVGGAVGVPLYLAQSFAGSMYVFAFREGLVWLLPDTSPILLDLAIFGSMFFIAFVSTRFAFAIQGLVLAIMGLGIAAFFAAVFEPGAIQHSIVDHWWGSFPGEKESGFTGISFWTVFAIFFPAATGILAGANMSGELKNPRRDIPFATLAAIAVSFVTYLVVALVIVTIATPDELVSNYNIAIDLSLVPEATLAAVLGGTFSSGLACFVGAPRILQALANSGVIPGSQWAGKTTKGEPRNALYITSAFILGGVLVRDLNAIAPMITMFFLITYLMVNLVVVVEQGLDMVSFRPQFPVTRAIPVLGTAGCLFAMFIISPVFGLVALTVVLGVYWYLTRRDLDVTRGDMRSGLFVALAEWAAKNTMVFPSANERAWKPSLLVPFQQYREMRGAFPFLRDLTVPNGSITLLGLTGEGGDPELERALPDLAQSFHIDGVYSRATSVAAPNPYDAIIASMQTLNASFFRPNVLFLRLHDESTDEEEAEYERLMRVARRIQMGVLIFVDDNVAKTGQEQHVNVWVRDQSPNWTLDWDLGNIDLELLTAFKLMRSWNADLRVITAVSNPEHAAAAKEFLESILELSRLQSAQVVVIEGSFPEALEQAPQADIDIFGLGENVSFAGMRNLVKKRRAGCLMVADSGGESILA